MRYENTTFENADVVLDDNEYVNCTITDCRLIYPR
jgi:hypothetical protein